MQNSKVLFAILCILFLLTSIYCTGLPVTTVPPDSGDGSTPVIQPDSGQVKVNLKPYSSFRPAIIFVINYSGKDIYENVTESIIRLFAENNDTVSVAVLPFKGADSTYAVKTLREYVYAGIIDINISYDRASLQDINTPCPGMDSATLQARLTGLVNDFQQYYGEEPLACVLGKGLFCEDTFRVLQTTGYKIVTAALSDDSLASVNFADFFGNSDASGLLRLPFAGNVCAFTPSTGNWGDVYDTQANNALFSSVKSSIDDNRVAVIEISPEAFVSGNSVDKTKLAKLGELVQYSKGLGEITTYRQWYSYMDKYAFAPPFQRQKEPPAYHGEYAIIFQLNNGARGWYDDTVKEIIDLFVENGLPLEVGIIPYLNGVPAFDSPLLRDYFNNGVIDISMHGYDWTYAQMDTSQSGLTYTELLDNLKNARQQIKDYYGINPVVFIVPYDYYDETGYQTIIDSGFKVFCTHTSVEPHPSTVPVDYSGKPDVNGLYRIPVATDVCMWDDAKQEWGAVHDVTQFRELKYYPPLTEYPIQQDYSSLPFFHDFTLIKWDLDKLGVAVISIHPDGFVTADGKPDKAKLEKLDKIIKWAKQFTATTTFDQWYKYVSSKEPES